MKIRNLWAVAALVASLQVEAHATESVTFEQAVIIAQKELDGKRHENPVILDVAGATEYDFGWMFHPTYPKYLITHDVRDMMVGGPGPIVVMHDGSVMSVPFFSSFPDRIEGYVRTHQVGGQ